MIDIEASIEELRAIWGQGAGIHKRDDDLARYRVIFDRVKPKVLVETGLYYGGSQLEFCKYVPHVINVELNHSTTDDYRNNVHGLGFPPENGIIVEGNSLEVFGEVATLARELAGDEPTMVILDSDHGTELVYQEAIRYGQLVTPGSYMVIEDSLLHFLPQQDNGKFLVGNWFDGDPWIARERFMSEQGDDWAIDMEIEDLFKTSQHPSGWLRRK